MDSLEASLKRSERSLQDQVDRREKLIKESRDVIAYCSRSIIKLHEGRTGEAGKELSKARRLLAELKKSGTGQVSRYLVPPEAEFVEASVVLAFVTGRQVPSISTLGATPEAYVLGLLDSVGELKRQMLDSVMKGRLKTARRHFAQMERLYSLVSPFAAYDHVVNGVRRKIDVARILVEDARGVLTEEARRDRLVSSVERLYEKLGSSRA